MAGIRASGCTRKGCSRCTTPTETLSTLPYTTAATWRKPSSAKPWHTRSRFERPRTIGGFPRPRYAACPCIGTTLMENPGVETSERLTRWITAEFASGSADKVMAALLALSADQVGGQDPERVQAALVVRTSGMWDRFADNRKLLDQDWRDVLVRADLANEDWPHRLDAILGPT